MHVPVLANYKKGPQKILKYLEFCSNLSTESKNPSQECTTSGAGTNFKIKHRRGQRVEGEGGFGVKTR